MGEKTMTVSTLRERLIERATADSEFRGRLLADPKAAIAAETGVTVPAGFNVEVHESTADTGHLILPPSARLGEGDLVQVAGGACGWGGGNSW